MKRKCRFCEREIAVNPVAGALRFHHFPRNVVPPSTWITPGERCPGTGDAR